MSIQGNNSQGEGRARLLEAASLAAVVVVCLITLFLALNLAYADLRVPFGWIHFWDAAVNAEGPKAILETGGFRENCRLAAPGCQYHYDIPMVEWFHFECIALLARLCGSSFLAGNLYFLAGPLFAAMVALYVLRSLGISRVTATAMSILYAFLPAFFYRGVWHLSLALYGLCPLAIVMFRWTLHAGEEGGLVWREESRLKWNLPRLASGVFVSILLGVTNTYYSFFFCCAVSAAAAIALLRRFSWRPVVTCGILVGTIVLTVQLNLLPGMVFAWRYGANPEAYSRYFSAGEVYGLKIAQMLLPVSGHRFAMFRALTDYYNNGAPLINENTFAALGIVGAAGFLVLIGWSLAGRVRNSSTYNSLLEDLGLLNLVAVLLATIGGFGALITLLITDKIRGYNRISPIIAFGCLAAMAIVLDSLMFSWRGKRWSWASVSLPFALTVLGLLDEIPVRVFPYLPTKETYEASSHSFSNDRDFVARIDALVPPGGMVFQVPRQSYWEAGPVFGMDDYDPLRAYLLSDHVHWSSGAIKGRWEDAWQRQVEKLPLDNQLAALCAVGFRGIYVDRHGFTDNGLAFEDSLKSRVGPPGLESSDRRYVFYSLASYTDKLRNQYTGAQWSRLSTMLMNSVFVRPAEGAGPIERDASRAWRWCAKDINLAVYNGLVKPLQLDVEMTLHSGYDQPATARIDYDTGSLEEIQISRSNPPYRRMLTIPPGRSVLRIRTDAKRFYAPGDPRALYVLLQDLSVKQPGWAGVSVQWGQGYYGLEKGGPDTWRWSGPRSVTTLSNESQESGVVTVRAAFITGYAKPAKLKISGLLSDQLEINSTAKTWSAKIVVPPGVHQLVFECDAKPVDAPRDPRVLVFMAKDFEITSLYPENSFLLMD